MAGEWEETTLGAEVDLLTGFPFKSERYTDSDDSIRLVRGDNIVQGALRWDGVKKWPLSESAEHEVFQLREGDVVLAMDRPWIEAGLKYAAISKYDLPCLLVQRTARLRGGPKLDVGFLRYLVGSREFTQHIHSITTGTAVPHISGKQIKDFAFALPPVAEQKAIAAVLGALDDKIEGHRRMNATLEAMARALFQSWFVEAAANGLPKGWRAGTIGDVAENARRGINPDKMNPATAYIGLEHMPRRSIALSEWGHAGKLESNKFEFQRGEILFGKLRAYFHKVGVAPLDGVCSTDILVVRPQKPEWFGFVLGHISSVELVSHTDAASTGTKMPRTNWNDIARFEAALPPASLAAKFTELIRPMIDRMIANIHESRTLATLRDTLLPKLLSGELRVREAKPLGEKATA